MINLLRVCNGIIAAAVLHSRDVRELPTIEQEASLEMWKQCVLGIRPYATLLDPHSKMVQACNLPYLAVAANSFRKSEVKVA